MNFDAISTEWIADADHITNLSNVYVSIDIKAIHFHCLR